MVSLNMWQDTTRQEGEDISAFHIHDHCELLYICEGQVEMQIGDAAYTLSPHQLAIVSPLEVHSLVPLKVPYTRIGLHIGGESLSRLGIPPWLSSALLHRQERPFHRLDLSEHPEVARLLCELYEENRADRPAREDMLGVLLHTLLLRLYRVQPQSFRHTAGDTRMEEARLYIETHFADSFSIEELARRYYLSPSHFIARFGEYTGYTPQKYRKLCRMAHARYLLTEGDRSLSAIAESCGFSDLNSFVRSFRETMQITPGQYRELARGKKEPEL